MTEPERKKIKLQEVAEFIKGKDEEKEKEKDDSKKIRHPRLEDIGEHQRVVLHTHSDDDQLAFIKPGPLTESEKKLCTFILQVDDESSFPNFIMVDLINMASHSESNKKEVILRDLKSLMTSAKFLFRTNEARGVGKIEMPWTLEQYIDLLKQVAMDAKEGKWFPEKDTEMINRYSMAQGTLNICMNCEID